MNISFLGHQQLAGIEAAVSVSHTGYLQPNLLRPLARLNLVQLAADYRTFWLQNRYCSLEELVSISKAA